MKSQLWTKINKPNNQYFFFLTKLKKNFKLKQKKKHFETDMCKLNYEEFSV